MLKAYTTTMQRSLDERRAFHASASLLRTPTTGVAGKLFQAVGVALPPNLQELPLNTPQPAA